MAAITLSDAAKQMTDPLQKGVAMLLLRQAKILELLPFQTVKSLTVAMARAKTLPTAAFRKINAGYTPGGGKTEQAEWAVKPLGGDVDFDNIYDLVSNWLEDPKTTQLKMKAQAVASTFNDYFINGSPTKDADGFYGLDYLVDQMDSRQKWAIGTSGTPFDPTASTANTNKFIDHLHKLNEYVGGADAFFMNLGTRLGVQSVLRRSGLLDTTKDQFGRNVFIFDNAKFIDMGLLRDQSTEVITDTEDPGDGGSDTTSIYAAKFGDDELIGIQLNQLAAYWVGGPKHELEDKPSKRARIDWVVGLAPKGKWCVAHMYNLAAQSAWT